jgi:peptidoglycan/xylan/chitin deacetylase (PgdA/CDA1 family)
MLLESGRASADFVPVLMYHDIADTPVSRAFRRFVVPPTLFTEHLLALSEAGYSTTRISQVSDGPACQKRVFVTFDDGFGTVSQHGLPALAAQDMTATLFLPTAFIGGRASWLTPLGEAHRRLLGWADVRDAIDAGFEIGSHGHRHLELDVIDERQLEYELVVSREILQDETRTAVQSLAYPFGYHDTRVRSAALRAGYRTACEVGYGLHMRTWDPMRVRRLLIGPDVSGECLLKLVNGGEPTVGQRARRYTRPVWRLARRTRGAMRSPTFLRK